MKKILLYLLIIFTLMTYISCSTDNIEDDLMQDNKLLSLKTRILAKAVEYELVNIGFDDEELINNLNMTDEQIEDIIISFAATRGKYKSKKDEKYYALEKWQMPTRGGWNPETFSGSASSWCSDDKMHRFMVDLSYYYSTNENSKITVNSVVVMIPTYDGFIDKTANVLAQEGMFTGVNSFNLLIRIEYSITGIVWQCSIDCDYSNDTLSCRIIEL